MNKRYLFLAILSLVGLAMSCKDESTYPLPYNDRETGAYMRVVRLTSNIFDTNDLANSALEGVFEIVDEEYGDLLESFEVVVSIRRGISISSEATVKTVAGSEFQPVPQPSFSKYKRATVRIAANDALAALKTTTGFFGANGVYTAGDVVNFRGIVKLKDGRTFTNTNTNINILSGQFYNSTFVYSVTVRSLLANSWVGTYSLKQTAIWSPNHSVALHATAFPAYLNQKLFPDQTVTLSKPAGGLSTEREFDVQYRGKTVKMRINLENGAVYVPLQYSGVDCTTERQLFWTWPTSGSFAGVATLPDGLPKATTSNRGSYSTTSTGLTAGNVISIGVDDDSDEYGRRNGYCTWVRRVRLELTKL